jgi:transcriptional regulator with GAF, ATPase, and Fis domain
MQGQLSERGPAVQNGPHSYAVIGRRGSLAAMIGMFVGDSTRLLPFLNDSEFVRECFRAMDSHLLCADAAQKQLSIDFLGFSDVFKRLDAEVRLAARSGAPVLITGERGVGKECIAYAIHHYSNRAAKPFVPINCAALSRELYLSELFGHCKGAFTNATADREGKFHAANHGTLFLDELADLPVDLQIGLQRALDHGEIQRVGSDKVHFVDVRICAATNKDIDGMVLSGAFPADLFDRLNVFRIHVPPLRERKDDIPLLLKYFSSKCCSQFRSESACDECLHSDVQPCLPDSSLELLVNYHWAGNIRELKNVVLRSMARSSGREVKLETLQEVAFRSPAESQHHWNYNEAVRQLFLDALEATRWNKSAAARLLGLPLSTMIDKMRRHGVPQSRPLVKAR